MTKYGEHKKRAAAAELGKRHPRMTLYGPAALRALAVFAAVMAFGVLATWAAKHVPGLPLVLVVPAVVALVLGVLLWLTRRGPSVPKPPRGL